MAFPEFEKDPSAVLDYTIRWGAITWAITTSYKKGIYVWNTDDGCFYKAKTRHTSNGTDFATDKSKWSLVDDLWLDASVPEQLNVAGGKPMWTITSEDEDPVTLLLDTQAEDAFLSTAWLSGGLVDANYTVTAHITSTNATPRQDQRSITIKVREQ